MKMNPLRKQQYVNCMKKRKFCPAIITNQKRGYKGKVISVSPTLAMEPGMTNANTKIVRVEV